MIPFGIYCPWQGRDWGCNFPALCIMHAWMHGHSDPVHTPHHAHTASRLSVCSVVYCMCVRVCVRVFTRVCVCVCFINTDCATRVYSTCILRACEYDPLDVYFPKIAYFQLGTFTQQRADTHICVVVIRSSATVIPTPATWWGPRPAFYGVWCIIIRDWLAGWLA